MQQNDSQDAGTQVSTSDKPSNVDRRAFMKKSVLLGAAAGAGGQGLWPSSSWAQEAAVASDASAASAAAAPGMQITDLTTPISKMKSDFPLDVHKAAWDGFNIQSINVGGDYSIFYSTRFPEYMRHAMIHPQAPGRVLGRDLQADLDRLTFTTQHGKPSAPLKEYLHEGGPRRVQAMMMAHKGKVVYEAFPGMNPTDIHVWYSASKTTVSILTTMLEADGLFSYDDPVSKHAVELQGTIWDDIPFRDAANMSSGLDIEETHASYTDPNSWAVGFWQDILFGDSDQWIQRLREVKPLAGEKPGDRMRYSTGNTMTLVLAVQNITQRPWMDVFRDRVWSHIGASGVFASTMAPNGVPIAGGFNQCTPEDMLRYAMLYTPSWDAVSDMQVVTDPMMERLRTLGKPSAFQGSDEERTSQVYFGVKAYTNSNQWDHVFEDGGMFKHGNMGQGIYVDPARDFCGMTFALSPNDRAEDHSPGYLRAAAKALHGS